jgi:hypothetical protein
MFIILQKFTADIKVMNYSMNTRIISTGVEPNSADKCFHSSRTYSRIISRNALRFLFLTNHRVAFSPHIFPMETHCVSVG